MTNNNDKTCPTSFSCVTGSMGVTLAVCPSSLIVSIATHGRTLTSALAVFVRRRRVGKPHTQYLYYHKIHVKYVHNIHVLLTKNLC